MDYNFREIEKRWQIYWVENGTYKVDTKLVAQKIIDNMDGDI